MKQIETLARCLKERYKDVKEYESMKQHTTLHIGGEARIVTYPKTKEEIIDQIEMAKQYHIPYRILGAGSNILVMDHGFDGLIIILTRYFHGITLLDDTHIRVQSGALLKRICDVACHHELSGLEFACGIPGTAGGGIIMNAGAYDGEMKDVVSSVTYLDEEGTLCTSSKEELEFSYRHSNLSDRNICVLEITFELKHGDMKDIQEKMDDLMQRRRAKQPLEYYSAGSTFRRPSGNYASALIADAKLMGYQIGDAMVSDKHAGFLINKGSASSEEFIRLIQHVQDHVFKKSGYHLECEIKFLP